MNDPPLPFLLVLLFIATWIAVSYLISATGGWRTLASAYADGAEQFSGERWYFQSGSMRRTAEYNGALIVGADRRGLYLGVLAPFRLGHPPLYIPWDAVRSYERRGWLVSRVVFEFTAFDDMRLTVSKKLGERVALAAGRSIGKEPIH